MIIYVIIAFVAILIGMAISVSAFGTGGKRKKIYGELLLSSIVRTAIKTNALLPNL